MQNEKTRLLTILVLTLGLVFALAILGRAMPTAASQPVSLATSLAAPAISATGNYTIFLPVVIGPGNATSAPIITSFTASPASIVPGGTSTLSWSVTGATRLSVSPGVGAVIGSSINVQPNTTTEYTLSAMNAAGTTIARVTVTVTPGGGNTGKFWLPYIGGNGILTTYGTSVAVDSAGGIHVGYALYSGMDNGARPAYYAYCAANCASLANWSLTRLSDDVQDVRLALDPQTGHPRLMIYTWNLSTDAHDYQYAACESGCTSPYKKCDIAVPVARFGLFNK